MDEISRQQLAREMAPVMVMDLAQESELRSAQRLVLVGV